MQRIVLAQKKIYVIWGGENCPRANQNLRELWWQRCNCRGGPLWPPFVELGVLFARQDVGEVGGVEVAAGDDGDGFAGYVGGQRAGDGAGARAFGGGGGVVGQ